MSHIGDVINSGVHVLRVIAADLDRDYRPEMWPRDSESLVRIWTREHHRFLPPCSRTALPSTVTQAHRRGFDDGDGEPSDTNTPTEFAPLILNLWPSTRAPELSALSARAPHTAPACRSLTLVDAFLPRPPPTDTAL